MFRIFTIAGNTFTEVIRQPVYLIILGCSMILLLLSPYTTWFAMLENIKLVKDMGLATLLITGLLLAAFSATNIIQREIENRTVLTIISKPVRRSVFILGKYLGIFLGLLVAEYLLSLVLVQTVRTEITEAAYSKSDYPVLIGYIFAIIFTMLLGAYINFFYGKPFTSQTILFSIPIFTIVSFALCLIDHKWQLQSFAQNLDPNIILATFLVFLATALLSGIAVAASSRFSPLTTLCICLIFFFLGLLSDYLFGRHVEQWLWAKVLYTVVPNLQIYLVADAVIEGKKIPLSYIGNAIIYTCLYLGGVLAIAIALFEGRETS